MTDLLTSSLLRPPTDDGPAGGRRSLVVAVVVAAWFSAGSVLLCCFALGLAGWFASDAGAHGDTRDALRVGADAWLLAHGSGLELREATVTAVPLGLTALAAVACLRSARRAAARSVVPDLGTAMMGAACFALAYATVTLVTAVLASHELARPSLGRAFVAAFLMASVAGGVGIVRGSGLSRALGERVPAPVRSVVTGAASVVLLMLGAGAVLVVAALLASFGEAANVLARLHVDVPGALLYTVLVAATAPNAALLAGAYLLGPGFAVGTGTVVSPTAVVLGPVPAFPLLAALPDDTATPAWTAGLLGVPVLAAAAAAAVALRRSATVSYGASAVHGVLTGLLGGTVLSGLAVLAGGSVGPGRMTEVGPSFAALVVDAWVAMAPGGLAGALLMAWWLRRSRSDAASAQGTGSR